jgi:hypothetical protein
VKSICILAAFAVLSCANCAAQELNTVHACRTYRDKWFSSQEYDVSHLTAAELIKRADALVSCLGQFDSKLNETANGSNPTMDMVYKAKYMTLALRYVREAYKHAQSYLDAKGLLNEFNDADKRIFDSANTTNSVPEVHNAQEGNDVTSGYDIPSNAIVTSEGRTFAIYKEGEHVTAMVYWSAGTHFHYKCDENSMCLLTTADSDVVLHARLRR